MRYFYTSLFSLSLLLTLTTFSADTANNSVPKKEETTFIDSAKKKVLNCTAAGAAAVGLLPTTTSIVEGGCILSLGSLVISMGSYLATPVVVLPVAAVAAGVVGYKYLKNSKK